jgi:hypothetical protein
MQIPNTAAYADLLQRVVRQHSAEAVELVFVDDVADWCAERQGQCRGNPVAMAIRDTKTGVAGILIRRDIDADAILGVQGRLTLGGFDSLAQRLDRPELFLKHLTLHELAHLTNNWSQEREDDCDEWAFRSMGWRERST